MINTAFQGAVRCTRIASLLFLLSLAAGAQITKYFHINGTASASSDFAWGFMQTQVNCVTGPAQGSPPSAFITLMVQSINTFTGTNSASAVDADTIEITRPTNFDFWVSSGCPATHPPGQKVTDVGGAPILFNPTIQEDQGTPPPPPPPHIAPTMGTGPLVILAGVLTLLAWLVLRRRL